MTFLALPLVSFSLATDLFADIFAVGANQFVIDFVPVEHRNNPADSTGDPSPAGRVDHDFRIANYEISRSMIEKANAAGGLGLTLDPMTFIPGGPRPNMPATGITWFEAARFVNWINTSSGFSPAYKFNSQPGEPGYIANVSIALWVPGDAGFNAANPFRNSQAKYFFPSADEWYKAAYYDPNANGGAGTYWDYPTGSDSPPIAVASGTAAGTAVYSQPIGAIADVMSAGGLSPYGVMGLGGNVFEWTETDFNRLNTDGAASREYRGGDSNFGAFFMSTSFREPGDPALESVNLGFRVASILDKKAVAGDFNNDDAVDDADLSVWKNSFGVDSGADADGDGNTDGVDFLVWQRQFGIGDSVTLPIPEPSCRALAFLGIGFAVIFGRSQQAPGFKIRGANYRARINHTRSRA
jgi:formylglycine-generating enzyme required for sulfatase activity